MDRGSSPHDALRRPRAEDRRPDPHHRAAGRDRGLEVGGHAHRQRVQRQPGVAQIRRTAPWPAGGPPSGPRNRRPARESSSARAARCRGNRATSRARASTSCGATPAWSAPPSILTWMHTCSGAMPAGRCSDRRCGDLEPVDACGPSRNARPPAGSCCSGSGRCNAIASGRSAQQRDLLHRFLDVVLAEGASGRPRRPRAPLRARRSWTPPASVTSFTSRCAAVHRRQRSARELAGGWLQSWS